MKYAGNPVCGKCAHGEHADCAGVWGTDDNRFWFECGCETCEAAECAAFDNETGPPKSQARKNFEDAVNALFGGQP